MSIELLRRLYAVGAAGSWRDEQLVADTLSYISALEHAVPAPGRAVTFEQLMFLIGQAHGALASMSNLAKLKAAVRHGETIPFHVAALRDCLTAILDEVSVEAVG